MSENTFDSLDDDLLHETDDDKLYVTEEICDHWRESGKWTYGIAFIGFLGLGFLAIALFIIIASIQLYVPSAILIIGSIGALIYFLSRNLYRYSWRIKNAADYSIWEDMENGFSNLHAAYKLYGVILLLGVASIIGLIIYAMSIIGPRVLFLNN